ncbi:cytochrome P450 [Ramaria rubella]|nr:cytochrome P450 [Ramaria rubella]
MFATTLVVSLGFLSCLLLFYAATRREYIPKGLRLPPGPPGRWILGNLGDMPTHHGWKTYTRWAKEYGDIIYLNVFGTTLIILNSESVALDLFEKRSKLYSDRFDSPMVNGLLGFDWTPNFMPYGNWWRRHRKMFHQEFQPAAVNKYNEIQTRHNRTYLRHLHATPAEFEQHSRDLAGATIMEITYGISIQPGDRYIETAEKAMVALAEAAIPLTFLVDIIPILKHVPEWMVGCGFKRWARQARVHATAAAEVPFAEVKGEVRAGTARPSVLVTLLEKLNQQSNALPDDEIVIRNVSAVAYLGGADTSVSAMNSFILAMLLFPKAQRKAQAELDSIVGMDRLPEFSDWESLPYTNALCREVMRWNPVAPLGVPHRVTQDDVYGDYFIPGGSIVIGNSWAILQDERTYGPEPETFRPERFLDANTKFPLAAFGYGRRVCPGRHLAMNSLFIGVASVLKVFNIAPAKDIDGNNILVEPSYTSGIVSFPEPFKCSITPRSASALRLLYDGDL